MFPLIPFKSLTFDTSLSTDEAAQLVSEAIAPRRSWLQYWREADKEFEGSVSEGGFTVSRAIRNRNSFLPYLYGKFVPTTDGVRVVVRMTLHPLVILFAIVWCTMIGSFMLPALLGSLDKGPPDPMLLTPIAMLLFFYGMVFVFFGLEVGKAERFLKDLFEFHQRYYGDMQK